MDAILSVRGLNAWYDHSHVVQDISFHVGVGEIVTLMGLLTRTSGEIAFDGQPLQAGQAHARFQCGLAYVPEDGRIVPGLSVRKNLQLGIIDSDQRGSMDTMVDEIAAIFPRLRNAWPRTPPACRAESSRCWLSPGR